MSEKIVATKKMSVILHDDYVMKEFKPVHGFKKRFFTEKKALQFMADVEGVPKLLDYSDKEYFLKISRLAGDNREEFSDNALSELRSIIENTINSGVARHSLPIRDILVDENDKVGVVDFERATLKNDSIGPFWYASKLVTKFHMIRFIYFQNPKMLSGSERLSVRIGLFFREIFNVYQVIRDAIRKTYRKIFSKSV